MKITKLKMIRLAAGITCEEMSRFIGLHPTQYSRLENNWERRVTAATNHKLIAALGEGFNFLMQPVEVPELAPMVQRAAKSSAAQICEGHVTMAASARIVSKSNNTEILRGVFENTNSRHNGG
jgi:transcriptional regulator with XRE-family HTH domain